MTILSIRDLSICLRDADRKDILRGVSIAVKQGSVVGIVGGSGSGKTTLGLAVMGLLTPAMTRVSGGIVFEGRTMEDCSAEEWRAVRGARMSMVFQEPVSAFNPVMTIGAQIAETVLAHEKASGAVLRERVLSVLQAAGIKDPRRVAASFAFELSGGLRQRAMIAQAIVCRPQLLIADEPTSSLDVDTQAKILDLFKELRRALGLSIIFITHDLGVVRQVADHVVVLCQGRVVEEGRVAEVLSRPKNKYTQKLLDAEGL